MPMLIKAFTICIADQISSPSLIAAEGTVIGDNGAVFPKSVPAIKSFTVQYNAKSHNINWSVIFVNYTQVLSSTYGVVIFNENLV
jgi:hypothetical protein